MMSKSMYTLLDSAELVYMFYVREHVRVMPCLALPHFHHLGLIRDLFVFSSCISWTVVDFTELFCGMQRERVRVFYLLVAEIVVVYYCGQRDH